MRSNPAHTARTRSRASGDTQQQRPSLFWTVSSLGSAAAATALAAGGGHTAIASACALAGACGLMQSWSRRSNQVRDFAAIEHAHEAHRYRSLIEAADVIIWEYDIHDDRFTYVSPQANRFGHPMERWLEPGFWREHLHPDDRDGALAFCASQVGAGVAHRFQYRMRTADGQWIWIDDFVSAPDSNGPRPLLRGVLVDITERVALERRLAASEAFLERTGEIAGIGGWSLDVETNRVHWTATTCRLHGVREDYTPTVAEAISFYDPSARPAIEQAVRDAIESGKPFDLELPLRTADGERMWVRSAGRPEVANGKTVRVVGAFQDITSRKHANERLEVANAELRRATDLASAMAIESAIASNAKTAFLATMSHEIRTPMTAILGYADLLAEEGDRMRAPPSRLDYIDTIKRNGEHLLALINDILDVSKIEAGKMGVESLAVRPDQALLDVASLMTVKAEAKGIRLDVVYDTAIPSTIRTDPLRLKQILVNLLGNAIKFTERGAVTLRVSLDRSTSSPQLVLAIHDTGIGMTDAQVAKLFAAFEQADASTTRRFGGSGLGLLISKQLSLLLGGDVTVSSKPGEGSVFTARIATGAIDGVALITPDEARAALHEPLSPSPSATEGRLLEGVRILLAEDGADNRRLIAFHLTKVGAIVEAADDGRQALERLTADGTAEGPLAPPRFDLIVTDIQMPHIDGYALATRLRAKGWRLPIVALTAHAMAGEAERCLKAGCNGYASKPIDRARLVAVCREALANTPLGERRAA